MQNEASPAASRRRAGSRSARSGDPRAAWLAKESRARAPRPDRTRVSLRFPLRAAATSSPRTLPRRPESAPFPRRGGGLWGSDLGWGADGRQVPIVTGETRRAPSPRALLGRYRRGPGTRQSVHAPVTLGTLPPAAHRARAAGRAERGAPGARGAGRASATRPAPEDRRFPPCLRLLLFIQQIILNNCLKKQLAPRVFFAFSELGARGGHGEGEEPPIWSETPRDRNVSNSEGREAEGLHTPTAVCRLLCKFLTVPEVHASGQAWGVWATKKTSEDQGVDEKERREANKKIEKQLQKERLAYKATHRLLLLGGRGCAAAPGQSRAHGPRLRGPGLRVQRPCRLRARA